MKATTISALTIALKTFMDEKENRMKEANAANSLQEGKEYERLMKECETAANEYKIAAAAWMDFVNHDWH